MSMDKKLTSAVYAAVEKAYDHRCDIEDAADEILEIIKADRKRRGEPVGYIMPTAIKQLRAGGNAIVGGVSQGCDVPIYTAPQPTESCASLMSDKTACGSEIENCDPQPAEPVSETARTAGNRAEIDTNTSSRGGAHTVSPYSICCCNSDDCRVNGCLSLRQAQSAKAPGGGGMPAEPVKPHLSVSYDDKYDVLYVDCDSNEPEPFDAEEDDKGILYRRAISDGRLIGITISNFMGPHAESRYGKGTP